MSWQIRPIAKPKRGDALPCMVQYCHDRSPIWLVLSLRLGKDNMYTPSLCIGYIELNCLRNWIEGMWFAVQLALSGCGVPWNMHFHHLSTLIFQDFCCSIQGEYTAQMVMCLNLWLLSSWFNSPPVRWGLLDFMSVSSPSPSPPRPPRRPPPSPCPVAILWVQCGMLELNCDPVSSVWRAGPQPRSWWVRCGVPDPNRDPVCSVWRAGPQLWSREFSVASRTPTAILWVQCGVPDLKYCVRKFVRKNDRRYVRKNVRRYVRRNVRKICQKICQKECQKICQKDVRKNVRRYVRKNVKRYVRKNVRRYGRKNVRR